MDLADLASTATGKGASLVGFKQLGTGAVDRTVAEKVSDFLSVSDYATVQGAIDEGYALGKAVFVPAGTWMHSGLTLYSGTRIYGENPTTSILKLNNAANVDCVSTPGAASLWGTNANSGTDNVVICNITIDGNSANNTSGNGLSIYGRRPTVHNVNIKNCAQKGMRTDYGPGAAVTGDLFIEGDFDRIVIDTTGEDGWYFSGPHDSVSKNVIVIDGGQKTNNTYDGLFINGTGRFLACHVWNRSSSANRHRYALNDSGYACEYVACHFEGGYSANAIFQGSGKPLVGATCRFYAAWNGTNVVIKIPMVFCGSLEQPAAGRPACLGIQLGTSAGDNPSNCIIACSADSQASGAIDFTYSKGGNRITITGYLATGTAYVGAPYVTDIVDFYITGAAGQTLRKAVSTNAITAAGTTQATATQLNDSPLQSVTSATASQGVKLPLSVAGKSMMVHNQSPVALLVYPESGAQINLLGTNNPISIPSGKGAVFSSPAATQWLAILGA